MRRVFTFMAAPLTAALLLALPCAAESTATARIGIKGAILPSACSIVLEQGGLVEYGDIPLLSVPEDQPLHLDRKTIPISLSCAEATRMRLRVRDERDGTAALSMLPPAEQMYLFGLGEVAGKKLGAFKLSLEAGSFTGYPAAARTPEDLSVIYAFNPNIWYLASGGHFRGNGNTQISFAPRGQTTPGSYVAVSGKVVVETWVNRRSMLATGQRMELNGSAMLELYYN